MTAVSGQDDSTAPTADTVIGAGLRGRLVDCVSSADGDAISAALDVDDPHTPSNPQGWQVPCPCPHGTCNRTKLLRRRGREGQM